MCSAIATRVPCVTRSPRHGHALLFVGASVETASAKHASAWRLRPAHATHFLILSPSASRMLATRARNSKHKSATLWLHLMYSGLHVLEEGDVRLREPRERGAIVQVLGLLLEHVREHVPGDIVGGGGRSVASSTRRAQSFPGERGRRREQGSRPPYQNPSVVRF